MATGGGEGNKIAQLVAHYNGQRLLLSIPTTAKVGDVVHKAVEKLKLSTQDLPLSLLYQGTPINDDVPLDVSSGLIDQDQTYRVHVHCEKQ